MYSVRQTLRRGATLLAALLMPVALAAAETPSPAADAPAAVADAPPQAGAPVTGPAMDELRRMADFLSGLGQFSVESRSGYDVVQPSGQKIEFGETRTLTLARPDRFRIDVRQSDGDTRTVVFDNKAVTVFDPERKLFASAELPGDLDASIPYFVRDLGMRMPLAMLFVTTLSKELAARVRAAEIVETSVLGEVPCVHLAARGDTVDMQIWLPTTGDPLPRRILLTYKLEDGQPQYWADFSNWNLKPEPPAALFSIELPPDAVRIAFLPKVAAALAPAAAPGEQP